LVVAVEEGILAKEHPSRLESEDSLARIYSQAGYNRE
ncbi:hypothetical protein ACN38_g13037, partial [Penicillium nordicum]